MAWIDERGLVYERKEPLGFLAQQTIGECTTECHIGWQSFCLAPLQQFRHLECGPVARWAFAGHMRIQWHAKRVADREFPVRARRVSWGRPKRSRTFGHWQ